MRNQRLLDGFIILRSSQVEEFQEDLLKVSPSKKASKASNMALIGSFSSSPPLQLTYKPEKQKETKTALRPSESRVRTILCVLSFVLFVFVSSPLHLLNYSRMSLKAGWKLSVNCITNQDLEEGQLGSRMPTSHYRAGCCECCLGADAKVQLASIPAFQVSFSLFLDVVFKITWLAAYMRRTH